MVHPCESTSGAGSHNFSIGFIREETIKKGNKKISHGLGKMTANVKLKFYQRKGWEVTVLE